MKTGMILMASTFCGLLTSVYFDLNRSAHSQGAIPSQVARPTEVQNASKVLQLARKEIKRKFHKTPYNCYKKIVEIRLLSKKFKYTKMRIWRRKIPVRALIILVSFQKKPVYSVKYGMRAIMAYQKLSYGKWNNWVLSNRDAMPKDKHGTPMFHCRQTDGKIQKRVMHPMFVVSKEEEKKHIKKKLRGYHRTRKIFKGDLKNYKPMKFRARSRYCYRGIFRLKPKADFTAKFKKLGVKIAFDTNTDHPGAQPGGIAGSMKGRIAVPNFGCPYRSGYFKVTFTSDIGSYSPAIPGSGGYTMRIYRKRMSNRAYLAMKRNINRQLSAATAFHRKSRARICRYCKRKRARCRGSQCGNRYYMCLDRRGLKPSQCR